MPKITIDGFDIEFEDGQTIMQAANSVDYEIPSMCYKEGHAAQNSCMMCVVKINGNGRLIPSCSRPCEDGMVIESNCIEVNDMRKTTLDLMLSDHVGDCVAPCAHVCPAHMEIPQMLRQVMEGENLQALITVKRDIPFPGILGRICPEICEGGCRRGTYDTFESICLVKRYVADEDLAKDEPWIPEIPEKLGKSIAIIGSGPTGMSCAYYLLELGYDVTIYDANEKAGGNLRYAIPEEELPRSVLDKELNTLVRMGAAFKMGVRIGDDIGLDDLQRDFDAIFIAAGKLPDEEIQKIGVNAKRGKPVINKKTMETNVKGVFAGGGMIIQNDLAIWALASGKDASMSIDQYLSGKEIIGRTIRFNSKIGKISKEETTNLLEAQVNTKDRYEPDANQGTKFSKSDFKGFTDKEAKDESARCLHCDCRAKDNCDLRDFSEMFDAKQKRFTGKRRPIAILKESDRVHLDAGKCIQCGLCVQIAEDGGEEIGLAYENRGFNTAIVAPLGFNINDALTITAIEAAKACPTGALSILNEEHTTDNPIDLFNEQFLKKPAALES
ncbi:MAG: (2Fe-2S)-binding protein [Lentisphaeria bacterium]|nr:FAD-dependent oxidoreductase [Lentisphaeria bacterium]NQZ68369.1 (2Fe-2S)-binding protein [Lentisphaeria bacterium]